MANVKKTKSKKSVGGVKKNRSYNNSNRSEKSNLNRQKIIELYVSLLVEANGQDVPLQVLAKKSKISIRTLFRFFGDKESLNAEIDNYLAQYFLSVSENLTKMSFSEYAAYSYKVFDQYEKLFKAYLFTDFGQTSRRLFRRKFTDMMVQKLAFELGIDSRGSEMRPEMRQVQLVASLINAHLWKDFKDSFGASGAEMSSTVAWAVEQLMEGLKKTTANSLIFSNR